MNGGFTFCGHDIADFGLEYTPDLENLYVYAPTAADIHEEYFDGHHGGYQYGVTKKPKDFNLRCIFEGKQIDKGIMTRIFNLFEAGRSGKLVFKRKPWCYYYATVVGVPKTEFTNYLNGIITITMRAYYPYARGETYASPDASEEQKRMHAFYNLSSGSDHPADPYHDDVMLNTGLFDRPEMVPPLTYTNITEDTEILLANPGTEYAHVGIAAMGDAGSGIIIANSTTRQKCKLVAMSKAKTTDINKEVYVDGINGKTTIRGNGSSEIAFIYHDEGFIELAPSYPVIRNIFATYNGNTVTLLNILYENVIGKYIFLNNEWHEIKNQNGQTLTLSRSIGEGSEQTMITSMNRLYISADSTMDIDRISFSYKPTFA